MVPADSCGAVVVTEQIFTGCSSIAGGNADGDDLPGAGATGFWIGSSAVPSNPVSMLSGRPASRSIRRISSTASPSAAPGARLKLKVSEGTPPSCPTPKAVLVNSTLANADRGTA